MHRVRAASSETAVSMQQVRSPPPGLRPIWPNQLPALAIIYCPLAAVWGEIDSLAGLTWDQDRTALAGQPIVPFSCRHKNTTGASVRALLRAA
jgi:hypothetical protein